MHHEPIFTGLQQPDQHGSKKDHQHIERRTQRGQAIEKFRHHAQDPFVQSLGHQTKNEPKPKLGSSLREHSGEQENGERAEKRRRPPKRYSPDIPHETGSPGQLRQLR